MGSFLCSPIGILGLQGGEWCVLSPAYMAGSAGEHPCGRGLRENEESLLDSSPKRYWVVRKTKYETQIIPTLSILCSLYLVSVNAARCPPRPAKRAASVVRLQAAELVKWRFRHGQVLAPQGKGKAMHRIRSVMKPADRAGWAGPC